MGLYAVLQVELRIKSQESRAKSQEPRAKNQEPRTKTKSWFILNL
jgi:hypothetical protein